MCVTMLNAVAIADADAIIQLTIRFVFWGALVTRRCTQYVGTFVQVFSHCGEGKKNTKLPPMHCIYIYFILDKMSVEYERSNNSNNSSSTVESVRECESARIAFAICTDTLHMNIYLYTYEYYTSVVC